ncbi:MAG: twin-arginine translocase subunit TatC [Polyangiales bacterium]
MTAAAGTSVRGGPGASGGGGDKDSLDDKRMPFLEHLVELRVRILRALKIYVVCFALCWWKAQYLLGFVAKPLSVAWKKAGLPDAPELHGSLAEPFTVYMRVALYGGLFLAVPAITYQLWAFIAPGLYKREKRMTMSFVAFATALFAGGAVFAYRVALPMMCNFFLQQQNARLPGTDLRIAPLQMLGDYFDFVLQTLLIFGLCFELPLVLLGLGVVGLVDHKQLWKFGRYFVLVAFTLGAIFSPPDVVSQIVVSVPLCLLYFLSIVLVYLFGTKAPAGGRPGPGARRKKARAPRT